MTPEQRASAVDAISLLSGLFCDENSVSYEGDRPRRSSEGQSVCASGGERGARVVRGFQLFKSSSFTLVSVCVLHV